MNLPTNLAVAIAGISVESDRLDLVLAARRDGFERPAYTCKPGDIDYAIAVVRHDWDLSFNLKPNAD
jgi:hypothetical protein